MSPVIGQLAGTHFAELLAADLNYDLINLARGGMSNGGIALQIEHAIACKPDLILFNITHEARFEINLTNDPFHKEHDPITLTDILYRHKESASDVITIDPKLMSEPLNILTKTVDKSMIDKYSDVSNINQKFKALEMMFGNLYLNSWKKKLDNWCMYAVIHKLEVSQIPYVWVFDLMGAEGMPTNQQPLIKKSNIFTTWENHIPEGYHTTPLTQIEFYKRIKEFIGC